MARYRLIKGEYHVFYPDLPRSGPEPDGDTVTFRPANSQLISELPRQGRPARFNARGMTSVRFEAIDTLETHFGEMHQDLALGHGARDFMLRTLGFTGVEYWENQPNRVRSVNNNPRNGYLLASGIDSNGRTLAFVYAGDTDQADGSEVFLDGPTMEQSVNIALIVANLTYGAFYTSLPVDLIARARELVRAARATGSGLWSAESVNTERAAPIPDLATLQTLVLWPKLFRRLADFFASGHSRLDDFEDWLREDVINRDDRLLLPGGELGNMHDLFLIDGAGALRLTVEPEEVVILPDDA